MKAFKLGVVVMAGGLAGACAGNGPMSPTLETVAPVAVVLVATESAPEAPVDAVEPPPAPVVPVPAPVVPTPQPPPAPRPAPPVVPVIPAPSVAPLPTPAPRPTPVLPVTPAPTTPIPGQCPSGQVPSLGDDGVVRCVVPITTVVCPAGTHPVLRDTITCEAN